MKNLLNINSRNKLLRDIFKSFEQEIINSLISMTKDGTKAIIMCEKVFNRFAKLHNSIKASRRIYTYKKSLLERQESGHPFEVRYKSNLISQTIDLSIRGKIGATSQTILMFDVSAYMSKEYTAFKRVHETGYPVTSLATLFTLNGSQHFNTTQKLIDNSKIDLDLSQLTFIYFNRLNECPTMNAENLANEYTEREYMARIDILSSAIFNYTEKNNDVNYLFGTFLDIAKLDNKQFIKFIGGEYLRIPYFGKSVTPITIVKIEKDFDDFGSKYEAFIKGDGHVVHLIYDDIDHVTQYHWYETSKKENLNINGNEFCIDDDFLEEQHLDLMLMVLSDCNKVSAHTNIKYDYQRTMEWVSSKGLIGEPSDYKKGILYGYLEQRGE